jgi:transcriptional regulator with XRE-family HTH domain
MERACRIRAQPREQQVVVDSGDRPPPTLADRLNHLFRTVRGATGREYSNDEVATTIGSEQGVSISASYIWYLRTGQRDNPTLRHFEALATFFGVPAAYFFDDSAAERVDAELALAIAMRAAGVRDLALRAAGLSTASLNMIADVIQRVRQLEGLSAPVDKTDRG